MLKPTVEALNNRLDLKFEFILDDRQRSTLSAFAKQEGFDIMQKLMEEELKAFNFRLMNTPLSQRDEILANHLAAQTATQWYVGFMRRIAEQINIESYAQAGIGTAGNPEQSGVTPDFQ